MDIKVEKHWSELSDSDLKEVFAVLLSKYNRFCRRGLLALYDRQTDEERRYPDKVHTHNGWGFSQQDQVFLSNLAHQMLHGANTTERQYIALKELLPKYAGQLVKIMRENQKKQEQREVKQFFMSQFTINNNLRMLSGNMQDLGLSPDALPTRILATTPSGNHMMEFGDLELREKPLAHGQGTQLVAVYFCNQKDKIWLMEIEAFPPADEDILVIGHEWDHFAGHPQDHGDS